MNTKHLKAKILDLAIRGKLVEQDTTEGNAADLLQKIRDEKMSHGLDFANAKSRKNKQQTETALAKVEDAFASDLQFEIPENWCWCRLGEIGTYKKGPFGSSLTKSMFVPKSETTIKVYEQQNAIKKNHQLGHYYIRGEYFESKMKGFEVQPGDILVSCAGTIGETYILPDNIEKGIINQALMKMTITKEINIHYFLMYFDHILKNASDESGKGTAMKNIPPFDVFKNFLFPLPPLPEQKRIVSAIEKAFAQIDIIEKNKLNLKTYIKQTKSKVLDLAIRGKLVEQNTEDGNAFDLLQKIREDKMSHGLDFANAKSRKNKQQTETALAKVEDAFASDLQCDNKNVSDVPFEIPENWCWCRFNDLFTHTSGKALKKSDTTGTLRRYITTSNLYWDKFVFNEVRTMYFKDEELEKCTAKKGDLLICNGGDVGRAAIWNYDYDICIQNHISRLRRIDDSIVIRYFFFLIWFYKNKGFMSGKGIGISSLTVNDIMNLLIPLPPLPEQKRIVAKIEQVFEQLDVLEKSLGE